MTCHFGPMLTLASWHVHCTWLTDISKSSMPRGSKVVMSVSAADAADVAKMARYRSPEAAAIDCVMRTACMVHFGAVRQ